VLQLKLISTSSIKIQVYIDVGLVLANLLFLLKISQKKCSQAGVNRSIIFIKFGITIAFNTLERFFGSIRRLFDHAESK